MKINQRKLQKTLAWLRRRRYKDPAVKLVVPKTMPVSVGYDTSSYITVTKWSFWYWLKSFFV